MYASNIQGLTEDQVMVRESVLKLLESALPWPDIRRLDAAREFPQQAYTTLAEAGYLGLFYPEEFGGAGGTHSDILNLIETLGSYYTGIAQGVMTTLIYAGMHLVKFGSDFLRKTYLPGVVDGRIKLALAMSEPDTGSDVAAIKTTATRDGSDYIVRGQKIWITCAHVADYIVTVVKTDKEADRHRGLSTLLIDARAPGVTIRPLPMLGRRTTHANEVFFDEVRVPQDHLIGSESAAWKNLMSCLALERLCLSGINVGHCAKMTDYAAEYAKGRIQFGRPITEYQAVSHKLVDMAIMTETSRQMTWRVARLLDAGEDVATEAAMAKIVSSESCVRCSDLGMQVMGGSGYSEEYDMAMFYRDARVGPIGGGTNEIQRNIIAKRMGLC